MWHQLKERGAHARFEVEQAVWMQYKYNQIQEIIMKGFSSLWEALWLSGSLLAYGADGLWNEICIGPKISYYACCALGQGT